jgi:transposase
MEEEMMTRKASGADQVASARELLRTAKTADELRTAQAVLLPLECGLSLELTARVIGRSVGATCRLRMRYVKVARYEEVMPRLKRELRNRAHTTQEHEAKILEEVLAQAAQGGVVVVPPLREKIAERLGKPVALSTVYRMLARNGWRKLAPDTHHPKGNPLAREDWKKNSTAIWHKSNEALLPSGLSV